MFWGTWCDADTFSVAVTKEDVRGTALIVVAVILILIFSSINHGLDGSISLERCVLGLRIAPCEARTAFVPIC